MYRSLWNGKTEASQSVNAAKLLAELFGFYGEHGGTISGGMCISNINLKRNKERAGSVPIVLTFLLTLSLPVVAVWLILFRGYMSDPEVFLPTWSCPALAGAKWPAKSRRAGRISKCCTRRGIPKIPSFTMEFLIPALSFWPSPSLPRTLQAIALGA